MNPKIDAFLSNAQKWQDEMKRLRTICLGCGLTEELKWGLPCYSFEKKNIVIIQGFKNYCALLFFKGYLLKDPEGILVLTGPNTKVGRQARFTDAKDIVKQSAALKACIYEAIEVERAGVKPPAAKKSAPKTAKKTATRRAKSPVARKSAKKTAKKSPRRG
jgi:uncharacterized protein YdeI (YjbR/CyaY-like superfamily)